MDNTNIQQFLASLTEEQRTAVLACKTEEELEQVIDEYDIDLPDEMLADVAGGKARLLPTLLAGIIMMSGTAFTAGSLSAAAAGTTGYSSSNDFAETGANELLTQTETDFQNCISVLKKQLMTVNTGRADPSALNNIKVDYYGTLVDLSSVASVIVEEGHVLVIAPFDISLFPIIESAIRNSDIGIEPINNGKAIRLVFPHQTGEQFRETLNEIRAFGDSAKASVRDVRKDALNKLKKMNRNGTISDSEHEIITKDIQKLMDKSFEAIYDIVKEKELALTMR